MARVLRRVTVMMRDIDEGMRVTVLVVAECSAEAEALVALLRSPDCHVLHARDGREAVEVLGAVRPDLVVVDLAKPMVSEPLLVDALRWNPKFANVPVLVLSDWSELAAVAPEHVLPRPNLPSIRAVLSAVANVKRTMLGTAEARTSHV